MQRFNTSVYKYQGAGNDFVLIESASSFDLPHSFVTHICDRHHGLGADGVLQVEEISQKPLIWRMRIYNCDGKRVDMCGNGLRCVSAHVLKKRDTQEPFSIQSDIGLHPVIYEPSSENINNDLYYIKTCFGKVTSPLEYFKIDLDVAQSKQWLDPRLIEHVFFLNSGVPHLFFLIKEGSIISSADLRSFGRFWRYHDYFEPHGTNVSVGYLESPHLLHLRTYERGVEEITLSCGTGAVAAAAATLLLQKKTTINQKLQVQFPGEPTMTVSCDQKENFWLSGPAAFVFEAKLGSKLLDLQR
jgi:diaminopimelate epimerase